MNKYLEKIAHGSGPIFKPERSFNNLPIDNWNMFAKKYGTLLGNKERADSWLPRIIRKLKK